MGGRQMGPGAAGGTGPGTGGEAVPGMGPGRGPNRGGPAFRLPEGQRGLFEESGRGSYYFVIWDAAGNVTARSDTAPTDVPKPTAAEMPVPDFQSMRMRETGGAEPPPDDSFRFGLPRARGMLRERMMVGFGGERAVVGHSLEPESAELRNLALLFASAGGGVLLLGLLVGSWFSGRAIRPIGAIGATASRIADGNLSERIDLADTESELGDLAKVLNDTFARLQSAIARQAQFTADASHELRTPAFVILSEAQSALKRERTAAEYREGFEVCQRAAQQMRQLIESLLILARQDAGESALNRQPCRLDLIAGEVTEMLRPLAATKNVSLHTELQIAEINADALQLRQIITNLVNNAVEYNRPGGEVRVSVAPGGASARLTVSDNGVGIDPEDLPHIFERFYRADKSRSASQGQTGLGLSICEAIVKAHGGRIEVSSTPGQGSQFVVTLPV
jgi:two-component system OmpR family sensor kinase